MAILTVTSLTPNVDLPNPQEMQYERYDVDADGTGRNQSGTMFRDRVAIKRKLTCKWGPLNQTAMKSLLQAVSAQFITLQFPDAYEGESQTMTCYVGDRSAPMYKLDEQSGEWLWTELSMNFIEQ